MICWSNRLVVTVVAGCQAAAQAIRPIRVVLSIVFALLVGCAVSPERASAGDPYQEQTLQRMLLEFLLDVQSRNPFPGGGVAVYSPSLWAEPIAAVVGVSDLEAGTPMKSGDRFLAGSVGKTFFAALALRMWSDGDLDLDRPIGFYLPDANIPGADRITVRVLLNHTSGIGEYDRPFMEALASEPLRVRTLADWLDVIRRSPPTPIVAGETRYSDLNYVVLAAVLDRLVEGSAYEAIEGRFLRPLGLVSTAPSDRAEIPGLVVGYEGASGPFGSDRVLKKGSLIYNPQFEWGGGGFASTPSDLARWIAAFRTGRAFPENLWPEVVLPPPGTPSSARSWIGLGVHVDATPLGRAIGHSGYIPGYLSWVRWYDDVDLAVAIQINTSDGERVPEDGFEWLDRLAAQVDAVCRTPVSDSPAPSNTAMERTGTAGRSSPSR